jgi:hypothetical protein
MILEIIDTSEESFPNSPVSITIESTSTESPQCRICFEPETPNNPLLYPCLCDGFSKYIHKECLMKWRLLNIEKPAFFECMECGGEYNINFYYPVETHIFPENAIQATLSPHVLFIYLSLMGSSLFFRSIDRAIGSQLIYLLDRTPPKSFSLFLKNDTLYSILFVYSYLNFLIFLGVHLMFLFMVFKKVNNPLKYFNKMFIPFIFHLAFTANIYLFYYIFRHEKSKHAPEIIINFATSLTFANLALYGRLMNRHNKIIGKINSKNIGDVLNRDEI